jgi:hypothetical protein
VRVTAAANIVDQVLASLDAPEPILCPHDEQDCVLWELPDGRTSKICAAIVKVKPPTLCRKVVEVYPHRCPQCSRELIVSRVGPRMRSFRCPNLDHEWFEVSQ